MHALHTFTVRAARTKVAKKVQRLYYLGVKTRRRLDPDRIRALRETLGLGRIDVTRALMDRHGPAVLHRHTLARWETNALEHFDYNAVTLLADFYGVPVDALLQPLDPPAPPVPNHAATR